MKLCEDEWDKPTKLKNPPNPFQLGSLYMFIPFRMNFIHPFGGDHPISEAPMVSSDFIFPLHPLNIPHEGFTYAVLLLPRNMG